MRTILVALIMFSIGIISSDAITNIARQFSGDQSLHCASERQCVGSEFKPLFLDTDKIGGLSEIACGKSGAVKWVGLQEILQGELCLDEDYTWWFRTNTTVTKIQVREGKIVAIFQGPLHTIDL